MRKENSDTPELQKTLRDAVEFLEESKRLLGRVACISGEVADKFMRRVPTDTPQQDKSENITVSLADVFVSISDDIDSYAEAIEKNLDRINAVVGDSCYE